MAKFVKKMNDDCCKGDPNCSNGNWEEMPMHHWGTHSGSVGVLRVLVKLSALALLLMLAIWVGTQIWGSPWNKNIRAEITSTPYARTITVEGDGKVTIKPDIARISLSVASTGKTVKEVTEQNNTSMASVIAELKKLGIKSEDIMTSSYDLYPQYDYNTPVYYDKPEPAKLPEIIGYSLTQSLDVKVRDLTKTDQVIDVATTSGANQVGSLYFDIDDMAPVKAEARKLAFDKAKEKAQQMAGAAGVSLGRVVTFSEGFTGGYPMVQYATNYASRDMMVSAESAAPAIESGSKDVTVNVSVTYEID